MSQNENNKMFYKSVLSTEGMFALSLLIITFVLVEFKLEKYAMVTGFFAIISAYTCIKSILFFNQKNKENTQNNNLKTTILLPNESTKQLLQTIDPTILVNAAKHGFLAHEITDFTTESPIGTFKNTPIYQKISDKKGVIYLFSRVISQLEKLQKFQTISNPNEILTYPGIVYIKETI